MITKPIPMPTDPEVLRFIEETDAVYPAEANTASAEDSRYYYDLLCDAFRKPRPDGVETVDEEVEGVPVRHYRLLGGDPSGCILYLHGGGFVVGSLESHDDVCAELCDQTGFDVVAADYRLAPEHVYPDQLDDTHAVWTFVQERYQKTVVAGDSAGGNLAAALCLRMRRLGGPMPGGMVLIYPGLGGDKSLDSYTENANAPMLSTRDCHFYFDLYSGSDQDKVQTDPELAPLQAAEFSGLPPTFVVSADIDPLRDDGRVFVERLQETGQFAEWRNEPELVHGYLRARHSSKRARESFTAICDMVTRFMV